MGLNILCPYYINSDRLLDLYAIAEGGIKEPISFEETRTIKKKTVGSMNAKVPILPATFSANLDGANERQTQETTRGNTRQTEAFLLHKTAKFMERNGLLKNADTIETILFRSNTSEDEEVLNPNFVQPDYCIQTGDLIQPGDLIQIKGKINWREKAAEDIITYGTDKNRTKEQEDNEEQKRERASQKKTRRIIGIFVIVFLAALFFLVRNGQTQNVFPILAGLVVSLSLTWCILFGRCLKEHLSMDTAALNLNKIKKDRKTVQKSTCVEIECTKENFDPVLVYGELYDDYLYQSSYKDFLLRNVSCLGVVKYFDKCRNPEEPNNQKKLKEAKKRTLTEQKGQQQNKRPNYNNLELEIIAIYS